MIKKEFTMNETVALMHEDTATVLRGIVSFVEKWKCEREEIIDFLIEVADNKEAQSVVVRLRDEL